MLKKPLIIALITYIGIILFSRFFGSNNKSLKKKLLNIKNMDRPVLTSNEIMDLSFKERFLKPMVDKFIRAIATMLPIKKESQMKLGEKLSKAGIHMTPKDYRAMNLIIIVGFGLLGGYFGISNKGNIFQILLYVLIGLSAGYIYRRYSLEGKITNRMKLIKAQLPEVMDILSVSVVAGLSFDQALAYVVERAKGPLIDEFYIVQREMSLGKPRKDALNGLSERCEADEIKAFTGAVIQADQLGISMQNVLNSQSKMIRLAHKQAIEEKAAKIPVKILIPMALFIFPVIFIVLLGPAVPGLLNIFGN